MWFISGRVRGRLGFPNFPCSISIEVILVFDGNLGHHSGVSKFARQVVGRNRLSKIILDMCKAAGIEGRKLVISKVTCATSLYQQDFGDQLIKERTGYHSLEAPNKYKMYWICLWHTSYSLL